MAYRMDEETGLRSLYDEETGQSTPAYADNDGSYRDTPMPVARNLWSEYDSVLGNFGGTAGLVAPAWFNPKGTSGSVASESELFGGSEDPNDMTGFTPEQIAARQAFLVKYPGYGQVTPHFTSPEGYAKTAGPSAGLYLNNPADVQYDETYGYITPVSNTGYAGGKGGHGDAVRNLIKMATMAAGAYMNAPGAVDGATSVGAGAAGANAGSVAESMLFGGADSLSSAAGTSVPGMSTAGSSGIVANGFSAGGGGFFDTLKSIYNDPNVKTVKQGYDLYKQGKGIYDTLDGLFSNNDVPAMSSMIPASQSVASEIPSGLSSLYGSSFGDNNLDPYGLNQRRRSFGRR